MTKVENIDSQELEKHKESFDRYYEKMGFATSWKGWMLNKWDSSEFVYRSTYLRRNQKIIKTVTKYLQEGDNTIVDIGCGIGDILGMLRGIKIGAGSHMNMIGTDISDTQIEFCRKNIPDIPLYRAPAECLPLSDGSTDIAILADVIEHVFDVNLTLSETARILKTGGLLILTTPNVYDKNKRIIKVLSFLANKVFHRKSNFQFDEVEVKDEFVPRQNLISSIQSAGFRIIGDHCIELNHKLIRFINDVPPLRFLLRPKVLIGVEKLLGELNARRFLVAEKTHSESSS